MSFEYSVNPPGTPTTPMISPLDGAVTSLWYGVDFRTGQIKKGQVIHVPTVMVQEYRDRGFTLASSAPGQPRIASPTLTTRR